MSKSCCYIASDFGEKEGGGEKGPPQYKVSEELPSTNRVNKGMLLYNLSD